MTNQAASFRPTHRIYAVTKNSGKKTWRSIGALWPHGDAFFWIDTLLENPPEENCAACKISGRATSCEFVTEERFTLAYDRLRKRILSAGRQVLYYQSANLEIDRFLQSPRITYYSLHELIKIRHSHLTSAINY
jgi:hypothetical protein